MIRLEIHILWITCAAINGFPAIALIALKKLFTLPNKRQFAPSRCQGSIVCPTANY